MCRVVFPPAAGLTDNWCTLEICPWGFWSVGSGLGVCLYFLVWAVRPYRGWPEMSYMLILSKCELWMTWLFLYRSEGKYHFIVL